MAIGHAWTLSLKAREQRGISILIHLLRQPTQQSFRRRPCDMATDSGLGHFLCGTQCAAAPLWRPADIAVSGSGGFRGRWEDGAFRDTSLAIAESSANYADISFAVSGNLSLDRDVAEITDVFVSNPAGSATLNGRLLPEMSLSVAAAFDDLARIRDDLGGTLVSDLLVQGPAGNRSLSGTINASACRWPETLLRSSTLTFRWQRITRQTLTYPWQAGVSSIALSTPPKLMPIGSLRSHRLDIDVRSAASQLVVSGQGEFADSAGCRRACSPAEPVRGQRGPSAWTSPPTRRSGFVPECPTDPGRRGVGRPRGPGRLAEACVLPARCSCAEPRASADRRTTTPRVGCARQDRRPGTRVRTRDHRASSGKLIMRLGRGS